MSSFNAPLYVFRNGWVGIQTELSPPPVTADEIGVGFEPVVLNLAELGILGPMQIIDNEYVVSSEVYAGVGGINVLAVESAHPDPFGGQVGLLVDSFDSGASGSDQLYGSYLVEFDVLDEMSLNFIETKQIVINVYDVDFVALYRDPSLTFGNTHELALRQVAPAGFTGIYQLDTFITDGVGFVDAVSSANVYIGGGINGDVAEIQVAWEDPFGGQVANYSLKYLEVVMANSGGGDPGPGNGGGGPGPAPSTQLFVPAFESTVVDFHRAGMLEFQEEIVMITTSDPQLMVSQTGGPGTAKVSFSPTGSPGEFYVFEIETFNSGTMTTNFYGVDVQLVGDDLVAYGDANFPPGDDYYADVSPFTTGPTDELVGATVTAVFSGNIFSASPNGPLEIVLGGDDFAAGQLELNFQEGDEFPTVILRDYRNASPLTPL
jgi:hypothetical protein